MKLDLNINDHDMARNEKGFVDADTERDLLSGSNDQTNGIKKLTID